jgi:hypothetical protein
LSANHAFDFDFTALIDTELCGALADQTVGVVTTSNDAAPGMASPSAASAQK